MAINCLRPAPGYTWKTHCLLLAPLLVFLLVTGGTHGMWGEKPRVWYEGLRLAYPTVTRGMRVVTEYSSLVLYMIYAAMLVHAVKKRDLEQGVFVGRFVFYAILFSILLTPALKAALGMPRPGHMLPPEPFSFLHAYASFPSGHTVAIVTAALPLALWSERKIPCVLLALLVAAVGISRLWLGEHHPIDIVGGIIVGSIAARLIIFPRKSREQ